MDQWAEDAITGLGVGDTEENDVSTRRSSKTTKKRASAAASKGTATKKRSRSKSASSPPPKRPKKPKPPPAPPASLVSLMKKDKSVLHFFTSLQENVTYDVDKWKHEAAHWKRMASLPSPEGTKQQKNVGVKDATKSAKKVQRKSNKIGEKQQRSSQMLDEMNNEDDGSTIPITDEALFGDLDSDNEEEGITDSKSSNDQKNYSSERVAHSTSTTVEEIQHDSSQTLQMNNSRRSLILTKLIEAKRLLDLLGVSLVIVEETKASPTNEILPQSNVNKNCTSQSDAATDEDTNVEDEQTSFLYEQQLTDNTKDIEIRSTIITERILHRQNDERVVADMMASLRTLIEASSVINNHEDDTSEQKKYHPFYRGDKPHCPAVYFGRQHNDNDQPKSTWQHPASVGLKHLIDVLSIMNVYCHDSFEDHDWEVIFEYDNNEGMLQAEDMTILNIGMRNRCKLVEKVLSSLHVEITQTWANTERILNLDSSAMHFYPTEVMNEEGDMFKTEGDFVYSVKNFNRLVSLEERIAHGRIASLLQRRLGCFQKATELVLGYVMSAAPCRGIEHYHPKIPPALSMCVLESLLSPEDYDPADAKCETNEAWLCECIQSMLLSSRSSGGPNPEECSSLLLKAAAFAIRTAADIWKERSSSSDKRIRDIALVEIAAYRRLLRLANGKWLDIDESVEDEMLEIFSLRNDNQVNKHCIENFSPTELGLSCITFLSTIGKAGEIIQYCKSIVSSLKNKSFLGDRQSRQLFSLLPACCFVYNNIMSRKWESVKLVSASSGRHTAAAFSVKKEFSGILEAAVDAVMALDASDTDWVDTNVDAIIQCYKLLGDALGLQRFAKRVLMSMNAVEQRTGTRTIISSLLDATEIVTVRVINLERRPDRLLDFMECAVSSERMLVMKGVASLQQKSSLSVRKKATAICDNHGGKFAFDGQCSKDELGIKVAQATKGKCALSDFVREKWKPSELSAFDKHAGSDFKDAHTSTSEKACALSHIASWFGVVSSLSSFDSMDKDNNSKTENPNKIAGMLTISGFARGSPLLKKNEAMDPSPVCVILEDDAILCDRFIERIETVLNELPRDFHFCSIGYSRPKLAPIINYSPEIGIPSCLWYLTGYILSEAGARFLVSSLPVVGPVDSWIAVKMRDNFANRYGDSIGVGKHARAQNVPLPKDLSKIMKFRAFAAQVPLCVQKQVVTQSTKKGARGGGNWRAAKKDSDVEYSGC